MTPNTRIKSGMEMVKGFRNDADLYAIEQRFILNLVKWHIIKY